jgi:hypothetical protein
VTPIVATLWGQTVLILAIRGERVTFVREGGRLDFVDLDAEGVDLTIDRPNQTFPIGYKFATDKMLAERET